MSTELERIRETMMELSSQDEATKLVDNELFGNLLLLLQSHNQTRNRSLRKFLGLATLWDKQVPYNEHALQSMLFLKEKELKEITEDNSTIRCITSQIKKVEDEHDLRMIIDHAALMHSNELLSLALGMRSQYKPRFGLRLLISSGTRFPSEERFNFIKNIESGLLNLIAQSYKTNCFDPSVNVSEFDAIRYATDYYDLIKFYRANDDEDALNLRLPGDYSDYRNVNSIIENIHYAITRKDAYSQIESRKGALASKTSLRVIETLLIKHKQKLNENGTSSEHIDKMHEALTSILP